MPHQHSRQWARRVHRDARPARGCAALGAATLAPGRRRSWPRPACPPSLGRPPPARGSRTPARRASGPSRSPARPPWPAPQPAVRAVRRQVGSDVRRLGSDPHRSVAPKRLGSSPRLCSRCMYAPQRQGPKDWPVCSTGMQLALGEGVCERAGMLLHGPCRAFVRGPGLQRCTHCGIQRYSQLTSDRPMEQSEKKQRNDSRMQSSTCLSGSTAPTACSCGCAAQGTLSGAHRGGGPSHP
jgi:hypothetical protein